MYKLKYRKKARNYLARLPLKIKTVIVSKLHELCLDPDSSIFDIDHVRLNSYHKTIKEHFISL